MTNTNDDFMRGLNAALSDDGDGALGTFAEPVSPEALEKVERAAKPCAHPGCNKRAYPPRRADGPNAEKYKAFSHLCDDHSPISNHPSSINDVSVAELRVFYRLLCEDDSFTAGDYHKNAAREKSGEGLWLQKAAAAKAEAAGKPAPVNFVVGKRYRGAGKSAWEFVGETNTGRLKFNCVAAPDMWADLIGAKVSAKSQLVTLRNSAAYVVHTSKAGLLMADGEAK